MSKWILIVIYDINILLLITPPLRQTGANGWLCRAWLRNDTPSTAKKTFTFLMPARRKGWNR
jgi:hypothetical protein